MRKCKISGFGKALSSGSFTFHGQTRYRLEEGQTLLDLMETAAGNALKQSGLGITDIDCIVCASATSLQPIPCNAALVHERIARGTSIPAMDINTTCTSFVSALDTMSYLIDAGRYKHVMILSGDTSSAALNPKQKESYELFSDAAAAFIISGTLEDIGILCAAQRTWSEGAHDTEIRGGGGLLHAFHLKEETHDDYYFDMKGPRILKLALKYVPEFMEEFLKTEKISKEGIHMVVPHQASKSLSLVMKKLGLPHYIDYVKEYGNMVSASIPFTLCRALEEGTITPGMKIMLTGTAAGLSTNILVMQL